MELERGVPKIDIMGSCKFEREREKEWSALFKQKSDANRCQKMCFRKDQLA